MRAGLAHRGRSVGSALLADVIARAERLNWRGVELEVVVGHERAAALYVRHGFIAPNVERMLQHVEDELAGRDWLCGAEFSAADVQMSFPLEAAVWDERPSYG